ncbi:hypothetical protein GIB67_015165 [Kingdonia uniflora]|uniref:Homeobox domain-containing protein n=1 Tax=Kingdonia uniflora TaxID=39325 RepID=A0A7J7LJD6_9MAGN|nr:hypothetical protein GIB67_015165 [Kingdonia uniflora]
MDMSNYNSAITITEFEFGNSAESIGQFLESQKDLFHIQIDQFEKIVVTQCKLTGVNPLAQEMAAGALSINIGKRPRDLLNPKAVKYMQSVFSIKDTIGKKDSREISALCGVTVTQVREFFAGQRARVRKFVRLSRDRAVKSDAYQATQDGCSTSYDKSDVCEATQDGCSTNYDPVMTVIDQVPLNTVDPRTCEEAPYSQKEEPIPGVDDSDKLFLESIFTLMKKEETFSGQVKLMEWILQVQNISLLIWFLTKGGVMILATWLSQAATEEQTSVLLVIFKVLCHLPLHKALPEQMSAILQTINRLRFYRMSDISNRAKVLLSRLSKLLFRSQTMKKPSVTISPSDAHKEKQRLNEMLCIEWQSNLDLPEDIFALSVETSGNGTKAEPLQSIKLLQASTDDSSKKHNGGVSSNRILVTFYFRRI